MICEVGDPHPPPSPLSHTRYTRTDYMMIHTVKYTPENIEGPCSDGNCRRSSPEAFCIKCVMTLAEVAEWPSLTPEEAGMLSIIVMERKVHLWELWEILEEPTLH